MLEENPNDSTPEELPPDERDLKDEDDDHGAAGEGVLNDIDAGRDEADEEDRRKYPRSEFTYPAEFKLFSQKPDHASFNGYLKDISLNGACLQFEDRYGRLDHKELNNAKIKILLSIPRGEKVSIFALIRRIHKVSPKSFSYNMRIEFQDIEAWQLNIIEELICMRNKDHNMMWNLWEQYENNRR
ncbi:MAG: PilZ domain-containing protein [Nitrospirae bacterium]|nr:PilZ domain-containing protein [Nitrospirota bacterium]